jgi:general secretion pathway protein E
MMSPRDAQLDEAGQLHAWGSAYGLTVLESVPQSLLDPSLVSDLSVEWARNNCVLPITLDGEACILTADLDQVSQQEYLSVLLDRDLKAVLAPRNEILKSIERCYYNREASPEAFLRDMDDVDSGPPRQVRASAREDLLQDTTEAPVSQLVNLILLEAVKRRASDIHFEPFESKLRVRYRIDGVLYEQSSPPKHLEEALVSRLKVMARMDIAEKRLPQDGMTRVKVGERDIDVRVSTIPVAEGERVVLRLLDSGEALFPLDSLGMSDALFTAFDAIMSSASGMVVVSGPTGSGKTTTLYAALGRMDAARRNIMTIEDPIEYQLDSIGQIHVKPKIGLTFATGLRHVLRQDPDIILVGETRDAETAEIALRAALTGHLVFTTLHTNDAAGAVLRLLDMGVSPHLLASCLRAALAQRLVRCLCPACKRETWIKSSTIGLPEALLGRKLGREIWEPAGCAECLEGYRGRTGIFEMLVVDEEMQRLIRSEGSEGLRRASGQRGLLTLAEDGLRKVLEGTTSLSEISLAVTASS